MDMHSKDPGNRQRSVPVVAVPAGALLLIPGNASAAVVLGDAGADSIVTGPANDVVVAYAGNDSIITDDGGDVVDGGAGNDSILTGSGNDRVSGGTGDDWVDAGPSADSVSTGDGDDYVEGRDGAVDAIYCGLGYDTVDPSTGDIGSDNCEMVNRLAPAPAPEATA